MIRTAGVAYAAPLRPHPGPYLSLECVHVFHNGRE